MGGYEQGFGLKDMKRGFSLERYEQECWFGRIGTRGLFWKDMKKGLVWKDVNVAYLRIREKKPRCGEG